MSELTMISLDFCPPPPPPPEPAGLSSRPHLSMVTRARGVPSRDPQRSIFFTTSMPSITRPKMTCLPSSHGVATVQRKNWLPLVFGPALATGPST